MARRKKTTLSQNIRTKIKEIAFSVQGFPLIITFSSLAVLFVLFRMKSVEIDYKISETNKMIEDAQSKNKDLKAIRANLLSVNNLRVFAKKYNLSQPKQEQIIVVQ